MIMFEIIQDSKSMYVNLDQVVAISEDPEDSSKTQLWVSLADDDRQYFHAEEAIWDLMSRVKAEIGQ